MRAALIALLVLAACGPKSDEVPPMDMTGLLVLVHDGARVPTATSADGVMPATGNLWTIDEMEASSRGVDITADRVEVIGVFDETVDLTARVPLTKLQINTSLLAGDTGIQGADYDLGPNGGTIWLTRIEQKPDDTYRVRGEFDGSICPAPDATSDCHRIQGTFAFDEDELPPYALTGSLIVPVP